MTTDDRRFAAIGLAEQFWEHVWGPTKDHAGVRSLVVPDVILCCGGRELLGVDAFLGWIDDFQSRLEAVQLQSEETFASVDASRVTSRWRIRAQNRGLFETPRDRSGLEITGLGVWSIQWDRSIPRLARGWIERNLWEVWTELATTSPRPLHHS